MNRYLSLFILKCWLCPFDDLPITFNQTLKSLLQCEECIVIFFSFCTLYCRLLYFNQLPKGLSSKKKKKRKKELQLALIQRTLT
jgi:hypothetical protein